MVVVVVVVDYIHIHTRLYRTRIGWCRSGCRSRGVVCVYVVVVGVVSTVLTGFCYKF